MDKPDIPNEIPFNDYYEYFAPTYDLHLLPEKMENMNDKASIDGIRTELLQLLQGLQGAPSVAMHQVPPLYECIEQKDAADDNNEDKQSDVSYKEKKRRKTKKQHSSDLYDRVD